jgi:hypothetical protein
MTDNSSSVIRVVQFNILSETRKHLLPLANSSNNRYLDSNYRYPLLISRITKYLEKRPVICLQDVGHEEITLLHPLFARNNYYVVTFGMIVTAFPLELYSLINVGSSNSSSVDWVKLLDITSNRCFFVFNTYYPEALRDEVFRVANDEPFVIAGDFGFQPSSLAYNLVVNGSTLAQWGSIKDTHGSVPYTSDELTTIDGVFDYIMTSRHFNSDPIVYTNPREVQPSNWNASDHYPLSRTITFN